jgi:aryl-alcohol dehydrogenase-like predicted oxidoreductase
MPNVRQRKLGKTGFDVSAVGVGTWAIAGNKWGPVDANEAIRGLQRAADLGCTLFDTVDAFNEGRSEELVGEALRGRRHEIRIVTKGGIDFYRRPHQQDFTRAYLSSALGRSLHRLRTDYVDVYMLHSPPAEVLLGTEVYEFLEEQRTRGCILSFGASVGSVEEANAAIEAGRVQCLMLPYNIFDQEIANEVFPKAIEAGIGVLARAPLALGVLGGKLTPKTQFHRYDFRAEWDRAVLLRRLEQVERIRWLVHDDIETLAQAAIAFTLSHPALTCATPGFRTVDQIDENLRAGDLFPLPQEDLDELASMYEDDFGFALPTSDANPWEEL